MRKVLLVLVLALAACGSSGVSATRVTEDRSLDSGGGKVAVPAASQQATVTARQALASCRKDGSCLRSKPATIELGDVTTSTGSVRDRLAYVLTFRHDPCVPAGPAGSTASATTCTVVSVVDATSGKVVDQFDFSE